MQMRGDNEKVQGLLGTMSVRCGRSVVGNKTGGLADFVRRTDRTDTSERARMRLLDGCALVIGRVLKGDGGVEDGVSRGERLVLAAKTWILMRLLIKSIGDDVRDDGLRAEVEAAKKTHAKLRRRLQRNVDNVLEKTTEDKDREDVTHALCAHALATSSGAKDVLHYFLRKRAEAMASVFDLEDEKRDRKTEDVIHSLRLYTRTLLDVQALVPTKLTQALSLLKSRPLLADPVLKGLAGLRLDVYERWCGEEIQYFTPFIRHDDLDVKQAKEMLTSWAEKGGQALLQGLGKTLEQMTEFKSVMNLRTEVLQLWIRDGGRARGFDPEEMQDELREAINGRMLSVLEIKVKKLRLVGSEIRATLEKWQPGVTDKHLGLWDEEGYDAALANGAATFIEEVVARLHGRSDAVSKAAHSYTSWYHIIDDVKEVVGTLKKQRWDNDYEEIEDEETIEERQRALSKEDPDQLQKELDTFLDQAFAELERNMREMWDERKDGLQSGAVAMYLVRVLRDIRSKLPDRPAIAKFGLAMVPSLHEKVVVSAAASSVDSFAEAALSGTSVVTRPLWEGEPALPTQSSPGVFKLLRDLSTSMGDAGMDLWSPAAVAVMKKHLDTELAEAWRQALEVAEKGEPREQKRSDDDKETQKEEEEERKKEEEEGDGETKRELVIQWLFDVSLLRCCVGAERVGLKEVQGLLEKKTGLDKESVKRITEASAGFWSRTSLLFGLLA